jgi:opacity protein-like surface antigen
MKSLLLASTAAAAIAFGAAFAGAQQQQPDKAHHGMSAGQPENSMTRQQPLNAGGTGRGRESEGFSSRMNQGQSAATGNERGSSELRQPGGQRNGQLESRHGERNAARQQQNMSGMSGSSQPPQSEKTQMPSENRNAQMRGERFNAQTQPGAQNNTQNQRLNAQMRGEQNERFNARTQPGMQNDSQNQRLNAQMRGEQNERFNAQTRGERFNAAARPGERNERFNAQLRGERFNGTSQSRGPESFRGREFREGRNFEQQERFRGEERFGFRTGPAGVHWTARPGFSLSVGAVVPRGERLHALPPVLATRFPQFRGFRYIAFRDRIAIVQPRTNRVVTVMPAASLGIGVGVGSSIPPRGALVLSAQERERISARIRSVSLRPGFALTVGATVPASVQLMPVPSQVVSVAPQLRGFRVVSECGKFAIVDPHTMRIVAVLPG